VQQNWAVGTDGERVLVGLRGGASVGRR